jgi:hypothetical protein
MIAAPVDGPAGSTRSALLPIRKSLLLAALLTLAALSAAVAQGSPVAGIPDAGTRTTPAAGAADAEMRIAPGSGTVSDSAPEYAPGEILIKLLPGTVKAAGRADLRPLATGHDGLDRLNRRFGVREM